MRTLNTTQIAQELAKALKKPIMLVSFQNGDPIQDVLKAAPYLDFDRDLQMIFDGGGLIVCDSVEEMEDLFNQTVGDDGPTKSNPYDGPCRVYALTINADGQLLTENT